MARASHYLPLGGREGTEGKTSSEANSKRKLRMNFRHAITLLTKGRRPVMKKTKATGPKTGHKKAAAATRAKSLPSPQAKLRASAAALAAAALARAAAAIRAVTAAR